ncbi:MAG: hypothetical protein SFZ23_08690 [Planctomycetota bacterium]|nr:hypothetical protein [Planctomycetota bacterium]
MPKDPVRNLRYRRALISRGETDPAARATLLALARHRSADACLWWINTFVWIRQESVIERDGSTRAPGPNEEEIPFITFPTQDRAIRTVLECIWEQRDVAIEKSREMGGTKILLAPFHWLWQYHPGSNFLEVSRNYALVWDPGEHTALLSIHEYMSERQPPWMRPRATFAGGKAINHDLDNVIKGDTTTSEVGHGKRPLAALCDEAARMRNFREVWQGLSGATRCRIANSTPRGPGAFHQLVSRGTVRVVRLPWWEHPRKGRGRYTWIHPVTKEQRWRSPWYDAQLARVDADPVVAMADREICENLDMDHLGAGLSIFSSLSLSLHESRHVRAPDWVGRIGCRVLESDEPEDLPRREWATLRKRDIAAIELHELSGDRVRSWRLWIDLIRSRAGLRPDQRWTYILGIDTGNGQGESNSVISAFCLELGRKVGELATPHLTPDELALQAALAGFWFGGPRQCALIVPETNGPGGALVVRLVGLGYPWIYRRTVHDERAASKTDKLGWHSSDVTKPILLREYESALRKGEFVNPSQESIDEARGYGFYADGRLGPLFREDDPSGARARHGDRVIADALANWGRRYAAMQLTTLTPAPPGSPAERRSRARATT